MSAAVLREAAALIRENADSATPGKWEDCAVQVPGGEIYNAVGTDRDPEVEICSLQRTPQGAMDSNYIASWHPMVTLLVAELLDVLAQRVEDICESTPTVTFGESVALGHLPGYPDALALATAYLGGTR